MFRVRVTQVPGQTLGSKVDVAEEYLFAGFATRQVGCHRAQSPSRASGAGEAKTWRTWDAAYRNVSRLEAFGYTANVEEV